MKQQLLATFIAATISAAPLISYASQVNWSPETTVANIPTSKQMCSQQLPYVKSLISQYYKERTIVTLKAHLIIDDTSDAVYSCCAMASYKQAGTTIPESIWQWKTPFSISYTTNMYTEIKNSLKGPLGTPC